jgi:hypothetical protein
MQAVLPRHLRPLRDKIFGPAPSHRLDPNAKARLWVAANAYNSANRVGRQHQGPLTWATLRALERCSGASTVPMAASGGFRATRKSPPPRSVTATASASRSRPSKTWAS